MSGYLLRVGHVLTLAAVTAGDGGSSSLVKTKSGHLNTRMHQLCAAPADRPLAKEILEERERRAVADAQNNMLDTVLQPRMVRYMVDGLAVELRPSNEWVIVIVPRDMGMQDKRVRNIFKEPLNMDEHRIEDNNGTIVYVVPKHMLRNRDELKGAADRGDLPVLSPAYTTGRKDVQIPTGSVWVEPVPGKPAIDALQRFAEKHRLTCIDHDGRFDLEVTSASRISNVFDIMEELAKLENVIERSAPYMLIKTPME